VKSGSGRAEVGIDSFDKGLVTLVPSDQAGRIDSVVPGANPNPQAITVQYGPDNKNAVVVASNVRFEDGAARSAAGFELATGDTPDGPVNLVLESQQVGSNITGDGKFLFICTSGSIYLVSPA
jgi:hypothetical protein